MRTCQTFSIQQNFFDMAKYRLTCITKFMYRNFHLYLSFRPKGEILKIPRSARNDSQRGDFIPLCDRRSWVFHFMYAGTVGCVKQRSEPTPESPPRRGLRGGYCEGGFGVKTNALIVRLSTYDEVHPTHNLTACAKIGSLAQQRMSFRAWGGLQVWK